MLAELNTRPRTTYLAKLQQPEPRDRATEPRAWRLRPCTGRGATGTATDARPRARRRGTPSARSPTRSARSCWPARTTGGGSPGSRSSFGLVIGADRRDRLPALSRGSGSGGSTARSVWGFAIVNFVWWIGIGHAGTLISAILLLLKQDWRTSINRFAEAMTLFAVACAGLFPLLAHGPALVLLLADAVPEHDGALAAVAQPAGLGRVRGLDLRRRSRSCSGTSA